MRARPPAPLPPPFSCACACMAGGQMEKVRWGHSCVGFRKKQRGERPAPFTCTKAILHSGQWVRFCPLIGSFRLGLVQSQILYTITSPSGRTNVQVQYVAKILSAPGESKPGRPNTGGRKSSSFSAKGPRDMMASNRLISGSGGNFDNLIDKQFIGRFPCCNFLTIDMLQNKINKIPTTTRNQTV